MLAEAAAGLQQADAAAAETSGKLGSLAGRARAARDEVGRLTAAIAAAEKSRQQSLAQVSEARARLAGEEARLAEAGASTSGGNEADHDSADDSEPAGRQQLADDAVAARGAEMEARLEVRTVEERQRAISGRADALASAAVAERQAAAQGTGAGRAPRRRGAGGQRGRRGRPGSRWPGSSCPPRPPTPTGRRPRRRIRAGTAS